MSAVSQSFPAAAHSAPLIFIVDDEPMAADIVAELLQLEGYRTRVFHDARVAAEELSRSAVKPDLLLADFMMPGLNGIQLLARGKAEIRDLKTILLSGMAHDLPADVPAFRPDQCLAKPFPVAALLRTVRRALRPA